MKCPNCFSNAEDQTPIGMNLSSDVEVYQCEKCRTHYGLIIFDNRAEADDYTETQDGEIIQ